MKTKRPLPKRLSGTKRVSGILFGLLALALGVASAASAAPFAYLSNFGSGGNVSVIDAATNAVVNVSCSTPPCFSSPMGVAVNPDGTRVYVVNSGDNSIAVIDTTTNTVVGTALNVGFGPIGAVVNHDGTRVYVTDSISVTEIDTSNLNPTTERRMFLAVGGVGIAALEQRLFVADPGTGNVHVIDTVSGDADSINVSPTMSLWGIAASALTGRVYVPYGDLNGRLLVAVIDPTGPTIVATVGGPDGISLSAPSGIGVSGNRVYVAMTLDNSVAVIDTATNTLVGTPVSVGIGPFGVAANPAGTHVFVGNSGDGTVSVINTATNVAGASTAIGASPLVFGSFATNGLLPPDDPKPTPPTCDGTIADLQKKVTKLGRHHGPAWLKAALYARAAAEYELKLAYKKVGDKDSRYLRAAKEFKNGDAKLCAGRYWRAKHEYWDAFDIAHKILRRHWHHRR